MLEGYRTRKSWPDRNRWVWQFHLEWRADFEASNLDERSGDCGENQRRSGFAIWCPENKRKHRVNKIINKLDVMKKDRREWHFIAKENVKLQTHAFSNPHFLGPKDWTHVLNFEMTWELCRQTDTHAYGQDYLKKLTPYIIIWLTGFSYRPDPIQDEKNQTKKTRLDVSPRQPLYVLLLPPSTRPVGRRRMLIHRRT